MNITNQKIDDLNAVVSVKIVPADYQGKVEEVLKDYRKKAKIDGFRPGMVPMGLVKKLYYKPVLAEEINKIVSENLMNYIRDEKFRILGEPLPHIDENKQIDFDKDTEFEFSFDIGMVRDFTLNISEKDKIPYYTIKIEDKVVEEYRNNLSKRFGTFEPVEKSGKTELVKGDLVQLDPDGKVKTDGISAENISISVEMIKDEEVKTLFLDKKPGDLVDFDLKKAFPSEVEVGSLLRIDRELAAGIQGNFRLSIAQVLEFRNHEINQELFDKIYGEGKINSEEEFRSKLEEEIKANYEQDSNYKFSLDVRDYLLRKSEISLPVDFLKRWILETSEKIDAQNLEKEFPEYQKEFQWQLVKDQLIRENDIKVTEDELLEFTVNLSRNQFYQYGLYNVPEEHLVQYAREQLSKKEESRRLRDQKFEDKIYRTLKEKVKLVEKVLSAEEFKKLFE